MQRELTWSPAALRDVQRLYRFMAIKNKETAQRAIKALKDGMWVLARQPGIGRPVDDLAPEYREWMIECGESGYVVLYRNQGATVVVLAIRHQREAGY